MTARARAVAVLLAASGAAAPAAPETWPDTRATAEASVTSQQAGSPLQSSNASLAQVLERAGSYLETLEQQLSVLVGEERYEQELFLGTAASASMRRQLVSDVAWVPTGDAFVWAFYRDVREVDGAAVGDRQERLDALFPSGATPEARARAQALLVEGSRYNLGHPRTVNSPSVALSLLHPRNQPRCRFRIDGHDAREGVSVLKLRFDEQRRPGLVRTSRGDPVPMRGLVWVEPVAGTVVATRLEMSASRIGPVVIDTTFRLDERLACWLPVEMRETYGTLNRRASEDRVEAVARYSAWRRARVEVEVIVPPGSRRP